MTAGSLQVAHWSDDSAPLVGAKGNVVGLNFFPPNSNARGDLWTASTDGAALLANSLIPSGPLTAPSASFPRRPWGLPVDKTVTITNTGYAFAVPSAITATGTGVTVTGGTCATSTQIAAGGTCTVSLQWTPTAAGSLSGSALTVDLPERPESVGLVHPQRFRLICLCHAVPVGQLRDQRGWIQQAQEEAHAPVVHHER